MKSCVRNNQVIYTDDWNKKYPVMNLMNVSNSSVIGSFPFRLVSHVSRPLPLEVLFLDDVFCVFYLLSVRL